MTFADMDQSTRRAVEETINILNTGQPVQPYQVNLLDVTWSLIHVRQLLGASGWGNFILHLQCLKYTSVPVSPKQPYILCYLGKPTDVSDPILLRHQIMVDPNYPMGGKLVTYDWLDSEWRKAVKDQIDRLNVYDPDMTRHPWALYRLIKVYQAGKQTFIEGITMIMQWQEVEPVGHSRMVEVPSSSAAPSDIAPPVPSLLPLSSYGSPTSGEGGLLPPYTPGDPEAGRRTTN